MDGAVVKHGLLLVASRDGALIDAARSLNGELQLDVAVVSRGRELLSKMCPDDVLPHEGEMGSVRIVLLDDELSDGKGRVLLRALRKARPDLKILFTAAEPSAKLEVEVRREGAYFYLPKPVNLEILKKVVAKAVEHESTRNRWKLG